MAFDAKETMQQQQQKTKSVGKLICNANHSLQCKSQIWLLTVTANAILLITVTVNAMLLLPVPRVLWETFLSPFLLELVASCWFGWFASFFCTAKWISRKYSYIPSSLDFIPIRSPQARRRVPVLSRRFSLVTCFIYSNIYMLIPVSQFIPPTFPEKLF